MEIALDISLPSTVPASRGTQRPDPEAATFEERLTEAEAGEPLDPGPIEPAAGEASAPPTDEGGAVGQAAVGQAAVGEAAVGEVAVGEVAVGEVAVGENEGAGLEVPEAEPTVTIPGGPAGEPASPEPTLSSTGAPAETPPAAASSDPGLPTDPGADGEHQRETAWARTAPAESATGPTAPEKGGPEESVQADSAPDQRTMPSDAAQRAETADPVAGEPRATDAPVEPAPEFRTGPEIEIREASPETVRIEPLAEVRATPEAAPVRPAPPPPPIAPAYRAVVGSLRILARDGGGEARIHLSPPDLGRVAIEVVVEDGQVRATLRAERPDVSLMLVRQGAELREALGDLGLGLQELTVETDAGREQRPHEEQGTPGNPARDDEAGGDEEPAVERRVTIGPDGVDVWA